MRFSKIPKWKIIVTGILLLIGILLIVPILLNYPTQYSINKNKVYFGSREINNLNKNQYKHLSCNIIKDSQNVYFNGEVVTWADAHTFISLDNDIFKDKNGIYYVTQGLYNKHKLRPIKAELDLNSFHLIQGYGSIAYINKINYNIICDKRYGRK